jgi:hypothetical protein
VLCGAVRCGAVVVPRVLVNCFFVVTVKRA